MANSNNWGEIYKSTWWGDEDWSANSLKIDSAPPGFAGQNLLLGSEELQQSNEGKWERLNINAVDANVAGVANPLSSDETVEKIDFQATPTSRILQDVTLVAGTQYTFSVWAKSAGASDEQFRLRYWDRTAASGGGDLFTALTTDWSPTSGRYSFTFTAASSGVHAMHIQNSGSVQRSIYFWGAMLNVGATAGDYIKTEFPFGLSNPPTPPMEFGDNFVGVTAYYSLRRFTTGEDNNAIRVRRSSDDTEQDIGFDANGDLDATALLAFVGTGGTDNGFVSKWYDQSGNNNDAINADASEQPLVVSGGSVVTENGKAAIDFDGVDDSFTANALAGLSRLDIFFATQTSDADYVHFNEFNSLSNRGFIAQDTSTLNGGARNMGTPTMYNNGTEFTGTTRDDVHTAQDGHQVISYIDADTTAFSTFEIGGHGGYVFGGKFQELIAFDSDQSSNRGTITTGGGTGIEGNINTYFNIV